MDRFDTRPKVNPLPDKGDAEGRGRFPKWLHRPLHRGGKLYETQSIVDKYRLNTVCEEAKCPNRLECFSKQTATFLAMGSQCTRACGFCEIDTSRAPPPLEADEPERVAGSVAELNLKHAVITMVARDDLHDGGADQLAKIIVAIRQKCPNTTVEVLTSDFFGNFEAVDRVMAEAPEVFNHNIETVRALTPRVRHKATYDRTLSILQRASKSKQGGYIKSGLMVGLGESDAQVEETITDLRDAGCDIITMGQYLQPSRKKLRVKSFVTPEKFKQYEEFGHKIGVQHMYCGPFVRSSYNAELFTPVKGAQNV